MGPHFGKMYVLRVCLVLIGISVHPVSCLSNQTATIRLIGGSKPNQGRLEISQSSTTWDALCGNSWTIQNTEVVCRQLGFPGAVTFSSNTSPLSRRVIHPFGYISCSGNESTLSSCSSSQTECQQVLSVDITCQDFGYVGCYVGSGFAMQPTITDPLMTNDLCIKECRALHASPSISHAILNETACFCSSSLAGLTRKNDLFCYILCPGNRAQSCGGPDIYTVFHTDVGFCVDPPTPILGIVTLNSTRYGSIVKFSCQQTYELVGNNKLQCLGDTADSLQWNGDYPSCAERRFVTLGLVFCSLGAILVFISMVCAVCGDIRRKMRKGNEGVDTEMLTSPIIQEQDTTNIRWNAQTNTVQQNPPPVSASSVAPSRPLPNTSTVQASQSAGRPHHPASVQTGTTPRSGEYSGLYEDLDDYEEDIGGGTELTFERHPSEEESYEHSTIVSQTTATARSGQRETEDGRGYADARSHHRDLSGEQEGNEGYLEVLPEEGQPAEPSCSNQPNTYLEVTGEGEPSTDRVESGHDYTYIANISKVDRRPQLPLPRQHTEGDGQPDYDDTSVQPIYKNEGAMCPRPRRPDLGQ